jgi:hypothetical protein
LSNAWPVFLSRGGAESAEMPKGTGGQAEF